MNSQKIARAIYKGLLELYPPRFKEQLGESMEQTFNDLYNEKRPSKTAQLGFVLWTFAETIIEITREHIRLVVQGDPMKNMIVLNPKSAALIAFLFTLPFMVLNTIAGNHIEPFYTIFMVNTGGGFWDHPIGHISLIIALLLLPAGAVISIRPMLQRQADGTRRFLFINTLLAVILLTFFFLVSNALISEIYRCNVLDIPNCD